MKPSVRPAFLLEPRGHGHQERGESAGRDPGVGGPPRVVEFDPIGIDAHQAQGEAMGPSLTDVAKRFRPAEILESIVEPSKVISDQYASKSIVTAQGKAITGPMDQVGHRPMLHHDALRCPGGA